jgi:hypothetical protein
VSLSVVCDAVLPNLQERLFVSGASRLVSQRPPAMRACAGGWGKGAMMMIMIMIMMTIVMMLWLSVMTMMMMMTMMMTMMTLLTTK